MNPFRAVFLASVFILPALLAAVPRCDADENFELVGEWTEDEDVSAVLVLGDTIVVGVDEGDSVQVGRKVTGDGQRFERTQVVAIAAPRADKKSVEVDIEALTYDGHDVFVLGSHSASRKAADKPKESFKKNRENFEKPDAGADRAVLAKFSLDLTTNAVGPVERQSLRNAIDAQPLLKPFVALASKENGIDLEGLTIDSATSMLFAGFRAPVFRHGFTPVLRFRYDQKEPAEVLLVLLDGLGIRDLVKVSDGFLILAGPVGDSDQPHRLYWWNGNDCMPGKDGKGGQLRFLAPISSPAGGKAEALVVRSETAEEYSIVVFYDGLKNGAPVSSKVLRSGTGTATPSTALCGQAASDAQLPQ